MKKNFLLLSLSIIISLFLFEIFLRIFLPQDVSTPWRVYIKDGLLVNKNNGSAFHYFVKNNIKVKYNFGEYHNRKYNLFKSKNKILILGDSNPFGWLLDDKDTYIYKLAEKFPNYQFINSAAGGHGTSDQLRYYEIFCQKIKPFFTFVLINSDDIGRSKASNLYYLDENKNLKKGRNEVPKIYNFTDNNLFYEFLISNFHFMGFLRKSYVIIRDYKFFKTPKDNNTNLNVENLEQVKTTPTVIDKYLFEKKLYLRFKHLSERCGSQLFLINLAWFNKDYTTTTYDFLSNNENFFQKNKIRYINLTDGMHVKYNNPNDYLIIGDGHPNIKGNELYFNLLFEEFKKIIK